MLPQYDMEQLILMIKRACAVPTSQLTYTDEDWAQLSNDMLQTVVVPLIMSCREDYFLKHTDVSSPADGHIPFPSDAIGSKLRNVAYLSQTNPLVMINLPRIDLDVVCGVGFSNYWTLAGFFIEGEDLVLYPNTAVPTNTTIRLYYYRRALMLAEPAAYGRVLSIDSMTNTVVLDNVPNDWDTGTELNSVSSQPNFLVTNALMTVSAVSSPSVVLDSVTDIEVGDFISDLGYSAVPQIPIELHNYLSQLVAANALEGLGDRDGAKIAYDSSEKLKEMAMITISQRVDGSVKKVINPSGGLRVSAGTWRRGWGF